MGGPVVWTVGLMGCPGQEWIECWPLAVWRVWVQSLAALDCGSVGPPWQQRVASMWVVVFGCPDQFFCTGKLGERQLGFPASRHAPNKTSDYGPEATDLSGVLCGAVRREVQSRCTAFWSVFSRQNRTHPSSWRWWLQGQGCAKARRGLLGCAGMRWATARRSPGSRCSSTRTHCKLRCLASRWSPVVKSKQTKPKHDSTRLTDRTGQDLVFSVSLPYYPDPASSNARPPFTFPPDAPTPHAEHHPNPSTNDIIRFCDASLSLATRLPAAPTTRDAISNPSPPQPVTRHAPLDACIDDDTSTHTVPTASARPRTMTQ